MLTSHPSGLRTLFFTEMWERFSYYGMRGLLVLYMTQALAQGGMGLSTEIAGAIYGLYTAAVYLAALPGGWLADRLLGPRQAVWYGGITIAAGHFTLALPRQETFFLGLLLVALGSGVLKTSMSTMVGLLYPEGGARRDAGFSLFYMGINLGAFLGPLVCSWLGEKVDWHLGFMAAGIGMVIGLVQYRLAGPQLGELGLQAPARLADARSDWSLALAFLLCLIVLAGLCMAGLVQVNPVWLAQWTKWAILALAIGYFAWALFFAGLAKEERQRVLVIAVLFGGAAMFWSGFEQIGSSLSLFADRFTLRLLPFTSWEFPSGWFLLVNAGFVILLAPVMALLWPRLAARERDPSLIAKIALGLLFLAAGFGVIALGAKAAASGHKVSPLWLIATYLLHTIGELCLSPVGLSAVTKLAPPRLGGQMMGIWFLGSALGNLIAGLFAGEVSGESTVALTAAFTQVMWISAITGLVLLLLSRPLSRMMRGVK